MSPGSQESYMEYRSVISKERVSDASFHDLQGQRGGVLFVKKPWVFKFLKKRK